MGRIVTDTTITSGRPEQMNRAEKELNTYTLLERLGISYSRLDHAKADTVEDCREVEQVLGTEICKNLFLCNRQKTVFYLLVMPGKKIFQTKKLSQQLGVSRLSFADPSYLKDYLDLAPGSVSVLGLMNDRQKTVRLVIDRDVLSHAFFGCHPCVNTSSLKIKTSDLLNSFLPHTGHIPVFVDL